MKVVSRGLESGVSGHERFAVLYHVFQHLL